MLAVSLLTITRFKRIRFLPLLFKSVSKALAFNPSSFNFIEWVFIDGSLTKTQSSQLKKKLNALSKSFNIKIKVFVPPEPQRNIGYLREFSNSCINSLTDVIICQDDDDWMLEQRIYRTCELFTQYDDCNLVGCGNQFMYDYDTDKLFTFDLRSHPEYHSVNSVLSYSYKYSQTHHYDVMKTYAEENSFTNDFKNKMYHLNPLYCIIQMSYANNTYNKFICKYQGLSLRQYKINTLCLPTDEIGLIFDMDYFIDDVSFAEYKSIFDEELNKVSDKNTYDITYVCGAESIKWSPKQKLRLGGSESAVINLAECWAQAGKSVEVYLNDPELEFVDLLHYKGVVYKHINKFSYKGVYNHIILWRVAGLFLFNPYVKINAKSINVDLHDHNPEQYQIMAGYNKYIDRIFYKSPFHQEIGNHVIPEFKNISDEKAVICPNGCDYNLFKYRPEIEKDPWRFVFASSYFRGLKPTLKYTWPIIYNNLKEKYNVEPSLHLYYGFHDGDPAEERREIESLILTTPGVFDHGRISREDLAIEKMKSTYHLYLSTGTAEICCISLKESLLSDLILVTSNVNIFGSFPSFKLIFHKDQSEDAYYTQCGISFCEEVFADDYKAKADHLISIGRKFPAIKSWDEIANNWLDVLYPK